MTARQTKQRLLMRFIAVTKIEAPLGPGFYIHPGLWMYAFNDPRSRRTRRGW